MKKTGHRARKKGMMAQFCAVKMRNAKLRNHLKAMKHSEVLLQKFVHKLMLGDKITRSFTKSYSACGSRSLYDPVHEMEKVRGE